MRMSHVNFDSIIKVSYTQAIRDLPKIVKPTNPVYKKCHMGK